MPPTIRPPLPINVVGLLPTIRPTHEGLVDDLQKFYPQVVAAKNAADAHQSSAYCSFSDAQLQLWTSSMFLGGALPLYQPISLQHTH